MATSEVASVWETLALEKGVETRLWMMISRRVSTDNVEMFRVIDFECSVPGQRTDSMESHRASREVCTSANVEGLHLVSRGR